MKVRIGNDEYVVKFKHYRYDLDRHDQEVLNSMYHGQTVCQIEGKERLHTGVACCSLSDQFCRATGRKLAFTRAVSAFDRDTRTQFWGAYLNGNN